MQFGIKEPEIQRLLISLWDSGRVRNVGERLFHPVQMFRFDLTHPKIAAEVDDELNDDFHVLARTPIPDLCRVLFEVFGEDLRNPGKRPIPESAAALKGSSVGRAGSWWGASPGPNATPSVWGGASPKGSRSFRRVNASSAERSGLNVPEFASDSVIAYGA